MKLATYRTRGNRLGWGVVEENVLIHLDRAAGAPRRITDLLEETGLDWVRAHQSRELERSPLEQLSLAAPIPVPRKCLALGGNYASHLAETARIGIHRAQHQTWFNKQVSCITGPYDPIVLPSVSEQLDYEGELGVVIGRRCRKVTAAGADSVIAGYLVCNDVSVRDWQLRAPTHTLGKSFDTHGPMGPWLVTADEIRDPHHLTLQTWVNGELRQSASTAEMIYKVGEMIQELTTAFTLEPGDILLTGSPAGVGGLMAPPRYLRTGDRVRVAITGLGHIENSVVAESNPLEPINRVLEGLS